MVAWTFRAVCALWAVCALGAVGLAGCGRIDFERCPAACGTGAPSDACGSDRECATGHCADGVCCDTACDGTCASCATGTCEAVPTACSGDCASCDASDGGFSCAPSPAACNTLCSSAVCTGADTAYSCDTSTCCATAVAPNFTGSCGGTATSVLVGDGCHFSYDWSSWVMANNFVNLMWDEQVCQQGTWVTFDAGGDAFPCGGCVHDTHVTWTDSCGNRSAASYVCP